MKLKLFLLTLFALLSLVAYQKHCEYSTLKSIDSYESCIAAKGSIIQESYPGVCTTRLGSRYIFSNVVNPDVPTQELNTYKNGGTYIDQYYKFKISLPENWYYTDMTKCSNNKPCPSAGFTAYEGDPTKNIEKEDTNSPRVGTSLEISINKTNSKNLDEIYNKLLEQQKNTLEPSSAKMVGKSFTNIGPYKALKIKWEGWGKLIKSESYVLLNEQTQTEFTFYFFADKLDNKMSTTIYQILSTFKFTN